VRFDDLTADGQTEPGAADAPMREILQAEELFEDLVEGVLGDAQAAVFHADHQKVARRAGRQLNTATFRRVLARIG
jgi:hypothetical protein